MHFSRILLPLAALAVGLFVTRPTQAQQAFDPLAGLQGGSFADYERAFAEWRSNNDINQIKGWKYHARWQHYQAQRLNPDGSLFDPNVLYGEAMQVNEWKLRSQG